MHGLEEETNLEIDPKQAPDVNPFETQRNTDHSENYCFILLMDETLFL